MKMFYLEQWTARYLVRGLLTLFAFSLGYALGAVLNIWIR